MRRALRIVAALCVAASAGVAASVPVAGQEVDDEFALPESFLEGYGWWSKTQQLRTGGGGVPSATCRPSAASECTAGPPSDGLYVVYDYESQTPGAVTGPIGNVTPSSAPARALGPTAYSAVRYTLPEGAETELSLRILSRSTTTPGGADPTAGRLLACLVTTPGWAEAQNGRYDQGPKYDCTSADEADVQGDTATFRFPSGMVQNGRLDVAIVGAGERPFQMAFEKPVDSSLTILNASELVEETFSEDFAFEDPLTSFEESSGTLSAEPFTPDLGFTATSDSPLPASRSAAGDGETRQAIAAGRFSNPFAPDASRGERIMAVSLLLALALALWWVGGQPVRPPRLLGSLGHGRPAAEVSAPAGSGGIGRFARPRVGRPPRLF